MCVKPSLPWQRENPLIINWQISDLDMAQNIGQLPLVISHLAMFVQRDPKVKGPQSKLILSHTQLLSKSFQCPGCSNFQIFNSPRRDPKWTQNGAPMRALKRRYWIFKLEISPVLNVIFSGRNRRENHFRTNSLTYLFYCFRTNIHILLFFSGMFRIVSVRSSKSSYFLGQKTSAWSSVRAGRSCWAPSAASGNSVSPHDGSSDLQCEAPQL